MQPLSSHPRLITARCVRAASPLAMCRACCTVCPRQAWSITNRTPKLDEEACDGCGICHPVCPENAIELPLHPALRENEKNDLAAFISCTRGVREQEGLVPCIHALGVQDLEAFARQGVTQILAAAGDCNACPAPANLSLDRKLDDFNVIQRSRGAGTIQLEYLPVAAWNEALRALRKKPQMPNPARRRFLGLSTAEARPSRPPERNAWLSRVRSEDRIYAAVPQIDITRCNGCDACVLLCPHGVLKLAGTTGNLHYLLDPARCTGCGLCRDVCDQDAVALFRMTGQKQRCVPLQDGRCKTCNAPFHLPRRSGQNEKICRICVKKSNKNLLSQVVKQ